MYVSLLRVCCSLLRAKDHKQDREIESEQVPTDDGEADDIPRNCRFGVRTPYVLAIV